jgi:hypothetical protein
VTNLLKKANVARRLGIINVLRVLWYRTSLRLEVNPVCRLEATLAPGDFFAAASLRRTADDSAPTTKVFGWRPVALAGPPHDWFENMFSHRAFRDVDRNWWRIDDFDDDVGDIKGIWEMSRFGWVPILALSAQRGNGTSRETLNSWLSDWCARNRPYKGPNWKCGQETSIRILNLALGALVLREIKSPSAPLIAFIEASLGRIYATRGYALAQNNNHGTSEAAGLFIGGSWLESTGRADGAKFASVGRRQLERLARKLINARGGFSQYSVNYHRVVLDTLVTVELWRKALGLREFSPEFRRRCAAATEWLRNFVDEPSGDVPNVGANDGAQFLEFLAPNYRDFRPSVQLGSVLFCNRLAFDLTGDAAAALDVLGLPVPRAKAPPPASFLDDDGGYACLRRGRASAFMRFPRFKFRPGHADALHLDLWINGENVLVDGGTYSYNCGAETEAYFMGVQSHNTIQFDDRDQMERVSRFLFASWPASSCDGQITETAAETTFWAEYLDFRGATHRRSLSLSDRSLTVRDRCEGFARKAVLRWRLGPSGWSMRRDGDDLRLAGPGGLAIRVAADVPIDRAELVRGQRSRYYSALEEIEVLEVEVCRRGGLLTEVTWEPR